MITSHRKFGKDHGMKRKKFLLFKLQSLIDLLVISGYLIFSTVLLAVISERRWFVWLSVVFFPVCFFAVIAIFTYGTVEIFPNYFVYKLHFRKKIIRMKDLTDCIICYFSPEIFRMRLSIKLLTENRQSYFIGIEGNINAAKAILETVPKEIIRLETNVKAAKIPQKYYDLLKCFLTEKEMKKLICGRRKTKEG